MSHSYPTAREAIHQSTVYGQAVECDDAPQNRLDLLAASDGDGDTGDGAEYWADDLSDPTRSAMLWRVRIHASGAEQ